MSEQSGPITREQVARAIDAAYDCNAQGVNAALGAFWYEREDIPADVRDGWRQVGYLGLRIALTRWRDELAAAEPARPEPAEDSPERLPATCGDCKHYDGDRLCNAAAPKRTFTWGGYVPPDYCPLRVLKNANSSPERLRERREALGLSRRDMANLVLHRSICMDNVPEYANCWHPEDVRRCEEVPDAPAIYAQHRARYAAALSAAEAERPDKPDHLAYADSPVWDDGPLPTPTPERPAPRFKVGDWARDRDTVFRVAEMHWDDDRWYARPVAGVRDGIAEYSLQPASPPAPEVVDVPQPIVKRCACPDVHDDVEAEWRPGEPYLTVTHTTVPLALLRAMIEAIDAQHPTRDRMPPGEPKLLDPGKPGSEVFGG